jgi:hypothetical protein
MPTTRTALQFVFKADQMKAICNPGEDILITSYLEEVITQGGLPVGAMRVTAKSKPARSETDAQLSASPILTSGTIHGCPVPPCID